MTTIAPEPPPSAPILHVAVSPSAFALEQLPPCDAAECPTIGHLADGTLVLYDEAENAFSLESEPRRRHVDVAEPVSDGRAVLLTVGPDDVAYLLVDAGESDPLVSIVAVALAGPRSGEVLARSAELLDGSGDTDFVPSRQGLVAVGCCGPDTLRPDPNGMAVMPWVDSAGHPTVDERPQMWVALHWREDGGPDVDVIRRDGATETRWSLPSGVVGTIRGMPVLEARRDGGATLLNWDILSGEPRVLTLKPSGVVESVEQPDGWNVVHALPLGAVIAHDGERFVYWALATFTDARDALDLIAERFDGVVPTAATPDDLIDLVVRAYTSTPEETQQVGEDCAERADAAARVDTSDTVSVTIEHRYACDDSGAGSNYDLVLASDSDGGWKVVAATERTLCRRGGGPDLCV